MSAINQAFIPKTTSTEVWGSRNIVGPYTKWEGIKAAASMMFNEELAASLYNWSKFESAGGTPLERKEFDEMNMTLGSPFEFRDGVTDLQFELMKELYLKRLERAATIEASGIGFFTTLAAGFAGSAADPTNILSIFVPAFAAKPAIQTARASHQASKIRSMLSYAKASAKAGAVGNTIETIVREPFILYAQNEFQSDYGLIDSASVLAMSPLVGGALGGITGTGRGYFAAIRKRRLMEAVDSIVLERSKAEEAAKLDARHADAEPDARVDASESQEARFRSEASKKAYGGGEGAIDRVPDIPDLYPLHPGRTFSVEDQKFVEAYLEEIRAYGQRSIPPEEAVAQIRSRKLTTDELMNNSRTADALSPAENLVSSVFESFGVSVRFFDSEFEHRFGIEGAASFNEIRTVFVSTRLSTPQNMMRIAGHELFHNLKYRNPELFQALYKEMAKAEGGEILRRAVIKTLTRQEGARGQPIHHIVEEAMADILGDTLSSRTFVNSLKETNPSLYQKVVDFLHQLLRTLRTALFRDSHLFSPEEMKGVLELQKKLTEVLSDGDPNYVLPVPDFHRSRAFSAKLYKHHVGERRLDIKGIREELKSILREFDKGWDAVDTGLNYDGTYYAGGGGGETIRRTHKKTKYPRKFAVDAIKKLFDAQGDYPLAHSVETYRRLLHRYTELAARARSVYAKRETDKARLRQVNKERLACNRMGKVSKLLDEQHSRYVYFVDFLTQRLEAINSELDDVTRQITKGITIKHLGVSAKKELESAYKAYTDAIKARADDATLAKLKDSYNTALKAYEEVEFSYEVSWNVDRDVIYREFNIEPDELGMGSARRTKAEEDAQASVTAPDRDGELVREAIVEEARDELFREFSAGRITAGEAKRRGDDVIEDVVEAITQALEPDPKAYDVFLDRLSYLEQKVKEQYALEKKLGGAAGVDRQIQKLSEEIRALRTKLEAEKPRTKKRAEIAELIESKEAYKKKLEYLRKATVERDRFLDDVNHRLKLQQHAMDAEYEFRQLEYDLANRDAVTGKDVQLVTDAFNAKNDAFDRYNKAAESRASEKTLKKLEEEYKKAAEFYAFIENKKARESIQRQPDYDARIDYAREQLELVRKEIEEYQSKHGTIDRNNDFFSLREQEAFWHSQAYGIEGTKNLVGHYSPDAPELRLATDEDLAELKAFYDRIDRSESPVSKEARGKKFMEDVSDFLSGRARGIQEGIEGALKRLDQRLEGNKPKRHNEIPLREPEQTLINREFGVISLSEIYSRMQHIYSRVGETFQHKALSKEDIKKLPKEDLSSSASEIEISEARAVVSKILMDLDRQIAILKEKANKIRDAFIKEGMDPMLASEAAYQGLSSDIQRVLEVGNLAVHRALLDRAKAARLERYVRKHGIDWLRTFFDGRYRSGLDEARMPVSIESRRNAKVVEDKEAFISVLSKYGVQHEFFEPNSKVSIDVARVIEDPSLRNVEGFDPKIGEIADTLMKLNEAQVSDIRASGVPLTKNPRYWLSTIHDAGKIAAAGEKAWIETMMSRLDIRETARRIRSFHDQYGGIADDAYVVRHILKATYDDILAGRHRVMDDALFDMEVTPGLPMTNARTLIFKAGEQYKYDIDFGSGNPMRSMNQQIQRRAEVIAVMDVLGANPERAMRKMLNRMGLSEKDSVYRDLMAMTQLYTGFLDDPVSKITAAIFQSIRNIGSSAFLGRALFTAILDVANTVSTLQHFTGKSATRALFDTVTAYKDAMVRRYNEPQFHTRWMAMGAGLDAMNGSLARRFTGELSMHGVTKKISDLSFTLNGVSLHTSVMQEALVDIMTQAIAKAASSADQGTGIATLLRRHGLSPESMTRAIEEVDGVQRISLDKIENPDTVKRFRQMIDEVMRQGVVVPDAQNLVTARLGLRSGTFAGEATRTITQFMAISMATYTRHVYRMVNAHGGPRAMLDLKNQGLRQLLTFIGISGGVGYLAMVMKDLITFQEPWLFYNTNEMYVRRWLFQTGLGGPISDFLFVRDGGDFAQAALGPMFGEMAEFGGSVMGGRHRSAAAAFTNMVPFSSHPIIYNLRKELLGLSIFDGTEAATQTMYHNMIDVD